MRFAAMTMLDYLSRLRNCVSPKTGRVFGESTVFNYFLKTMVFLNDRCIAKYVAKEDWVLKKDWPINVDKRNKNKKYATYLEEEVAAMLQVADVRILGKSIRVPKGRRSAFLRIPIM